MVCILFKRAAYLLVLIPFFLTYSYDEIQFKQDLSSAYTHQENSVIWKYGLLTTSSIILLRDSGADKFQEDMAKNKPLGDFAVIGDYSGQLVPNVTYMAYQSFYGQNKLLANSRSNLMLRASLFAGGTTFFLKRIFNQRRPSKGDRLSFPSGHTTTAFAFAGVIHREHPEWKIEAYALASLVGLSRLNDNAHYLHDVAMGATIGLAYAFGLEKRKFSNLSFFPGKDALFLSYLF